MMLPRRESLGESRPTTSNHFSSLIKHYMERKAEKKEEKIIPEQKPPRTANLNMGNTLPSINCFNRNVQKTEINLKINRERREKEKISISSLYINQWSPDEFNVYDFDVLVISKVEDIFSQITEIQEKENIRVWKLFKGKEFKYVYDSFHRGSYNLICAFPVDYRQTFSHQMVENGDKLVVAESNTIIDSIPPSPLHKKHNSYYQYSGRPQTSYKSRIKGIKNKENMSYMNSVLQCLYSSTKLTEYFNTRYHDGVLFNAYMNFVKEMQSDASYLFSSSKIKRAIDQHTSQFRDLIEHESHDFLKVFIEAMNIEIQGTRQQNSETEELPIGLSKHQLKQLSWNLFKINNSDNFADLCYGQFLSNISCNRCKNEQNFSINFSSISFPLSPDNNCVPSNNKFEKTLLFVPLDISKEILTFTYVFEGKQLLGSKNFQNYVKSHFMVKMVLIAEIKDDRYYREISSSDEINKDMKIVVYEKDTRSNRTVILEVVSGNQFQGIPRLMFLPNSMNMNKVCLEVFKLANTVFHIENGNTKRNAETFMLKYRLQSKIKFFYLSKNISSSGLVECPLPIESYYKLQGRNPSESNLHIRIKNVSYPLRSNEENPNTRPISDYPELARYREKKLSLYNCFARLIKKQKISRKDSKCCPNCYSQNPSTKTLQISKIPDSLIVNLNRPYNNHYYILDQSVEIDFPFEKLNLNKFVLESGDHLYDLHGIVCLDGSSDTRKYMSYSKRNGNWYSFKHTNVSKVTSMKREVDKSSALILFYEKKNC